MSNLDHIILYVILFTAFFCITRIRQQHIDKQYWLVLLIPIVLYSIIVGCRYDWGNDYLWYKRRFEHPYDYRSEDPGFLCLNLFIKEFIGDYVAAYIVYSLIFIVCAFIWIKDYYNENKYMLALFLPATLLLSTFTIRQSVGHGLVFLALHFFQNKKWILFPLCLLVAYSIHPASVLLIILLLPLYYWVNKPFSWKLTIPIYVTVSLFTDYINQFVTKIYSLYAPLLVVGNKFDTYLQAAWFNRKAIQVDWEQSPLAFIMSIIFHVGIIYLGHISLKYSPRKSVAYVYNAVVIGLIATRAFWYFEILRRVTDAFVQLYFIPLGYAIYFMTLYYNILPKKEKILCFICISFALIYLLLYFGRFIFQSPGYIFIWNK